MADLKIELVEIDGEKRIPPDLFALLMEVGEHRNICDQCTRAWAAQNAALYCPTSTTLWDEILADRRVTIE